MAEWHANNFDHSDGTIVSGDSLGHVKFWDSRTCTQLHSFPAHGADVLALTINPEGKAVYTSGVDQKTVQFSLVKTNSSTSPTAFRWAQTASRRMHSHDVRALASWPPYMPLPANYKRTYPLDMAPILVSGGLDMSVVLSPAALPESTVTKVINPLVTSTEATFGDAYHRRMAYTVGNTIHVSRNKRLVLCLREAGLSVWRILKRPEEEVTEEPQEGEVEPWSGGWEKVLEMELNVTSNLVAGEISEDGRWLAVSDMYEAKLFSLRIDVCVPRSAAVYTYLTFFSGPGPVFCQTRERLPRSCPVQYSKCLFKHQSGRCCTSVYTGFIETHPLDRSNVIHSHI